MKDAEYDLWLRFRPEGTLQSESRTCFRMQSPRQESLRISHLISWRKDGNWQKWQSSEKG